MAPLQPLSREGRSVPRILVVDDESHVRLLNSEVLKKAGYVVDVAANGADGWTALQTTAYDLLITDNVMPGVTGLEMVKKLRESQMIVPVIMATGTCPKEEIARNPELQPAALLLKPFASDLLVATVKKVLELPKDQED
jgi:CheY-like chemotaxis protein